MANPHNSAPFGGNSLDNMHHQLNNFDINFALRSYSEAPHRFDENHIDFLELEKDNNNPRISR